MSSRLALNGRTTEKIFCSRMRRAISCEYCAPKSRTTMDWVSTDECLRLRGRLQQIETITTEDTEVHRETQGNAFRCDPQCPLRLSHVIAHYRTTTFTSFFDTTIVFTICLPAIAAFTFSFASAACST